MIYHFILNPKSGRSKKHRKLEAVIKDACIKRQFSYHIYYTTCIGDATEYVRSLVRISNERQRFICVGGDGTLNELVNSAPSNPNVEIGVIPGGTGNDFIRNFSGTKHFSSVEDQLDGEPISIDLIKCNDFYCVNMVNIGFDCAVVKEAAKLKQYKLVSPGMSYILGVVAVLFKKFGTKMKIIFEDGEVLDGEFTLTAIGNGKFCGGGFMAAPLACLDDGLLDVCVIDKISRMTFISLVKTYKNGTYINNRRAKKIIRTKRVPSFRMEFDTPLPICIDGEINGAKTIDFSVVKNALNFVIPKGSEYKASSLNAKNNDNHGRSKK